jgi:hypothetical protein
MSKSGFQKHPLPKGARYESKQGILEVYTAIYLEEMERRRNEQAAAVNGEVTHLKMEEDDASFSKSESSTQSFCLERYSFPCLLLV